MIVAPPPDLELFARLAVDDAEFSVQVESAPEPVGHRLSIVCARGCPTPVSLVEPHGEVPLTLLRRWDGGPLLYTLWASGSAYRVKVYALSAKAVASVLDVASLARPDFQSDARGDELVRTTERRTERSPPGEVRRVTWAWTGAKFVRRVSR